MLPPWANPLVWPLKTELRWVPFCLAKFAGDQEHPLNSQFQVRRSQDPVQSTMAVSERCIMPFISHLSCFHYDQNLMAKLLSSVHRNACCLCAFARKWSCGELLYVKMDSQVLTGNMQSFEKTKNFEHKRVKWQRVWWMCCQMWNHSFFPLLSVFNSYLKKDHFEMKMQNRWKKI